MGVLNVTPDSFSDGGRFLDPADAIAHAERLVAEGADLVDVGGESTRPGAEPVAEQDELARVLPVLEPLGAAGVPLSIDSSKASIASRALAAGALFVNDVTALRGDPGMAEVVASSKAELCLMHMLGDPRTMQENPRYVDVVSEVKRFLEERLEFAVGEGIAEQRVWLDPGIGFGKTLEDNLALLRRLDEIVAIGRPVLVGVSRKRFLGEITGKPEDRRGPAGLAAALVAYEKGATMVRVHEVGPTRDALLVAAATLS
jgi:dihydropteroate synthase